MIGQPLKALTFIIALCGAILLSPPALALLESDDQDTRTLQDYIGDFVDIPQGATDWRVFGATEEKLIEGVDENGYDFVYAVPVFPEAVKKLQGQTIRIKGFMFPLDEADAQSQFLFGPFPISCPFHYHVGANLILQVMPHRPINFTYEPITLEGTVELIEEDKDWGLFYRLKDARPVP